MSKLIHNPALAEIQDLSDNVATFVVKPLEPGYGNTLGACDECFFQALMVQQ